MKSPNSILTQNDLSKFIYELYLESQSDDCQWENQTLPSFLEAMAAWCEDMDMKNLGIGTQEASPWQVCAWILSSAAIYE